MEEKSIAILRQIAAKVPYRQIAQEHGVSFWRVYEIGQRHQVARRCQHLTARQRLAIVADLTKTNQSFRAIAAKHKTSKGQVHRIAVDLRRRASKEAGQMEFETNTRTTHVCPKHGKLSVWPCVACAALAARDGAA